MNENPAKYETKSKFSFVDDDEPTSPIKVIEIDGKRYRVIGISRVPKIESKSKEARKEEGVTADEKE